MKTQNRRFVLVGALGWLAAAGACSDVTRPGGIGPVAPSFNTTTEDESARLQVYKDATPEWTTDGSYTWSVSKTGPLEVEIKPGESKSLAYTVTVQRTASSTSEFFGVTGKICVTNNGPSSTRGLRVIDQLLFWDDALGDWKPFGPETLVDVSAHPDLDPGTTWCYPYRIAVDRSQVPASKLGYRNQARIFIDNFKEGYEEYAIHKTQPFVFPGSPTGTTSGGTAVVDDQVTCPAGFECSPTTAEWTFSDSGTQSFTVQVRNTGAACNTYHDLKNVATLRAGDAQTSSQVVTTVSTGLCAPKTITACTPGFWKQSQHFQYWSGSSPTTSLGSVFSASSGYTLKGANLGSYTLLQGLNFGGGPGALGAAQILTRAAVAALLNNAHSGGDVAALKAAVNQALASGNRRIMLDLAEALDAANNGVCTVKG